MAKGDKSKDSNQDEESRLKVSDAVKKLLTAGVGAAFMTEESIRAYLGDLKLPKDAVNYLLQGANKSKAELMDRVGNEIVRIISKIDFVSEASKFVEEHKFKISAEVEVIRKDTSFEVKIESGDS